ncbi:MAG: LysM peptidoglycan-binding domain-containing protein, partial [Boseongicola sp. SB0667_bin_21]|nr:LysM peptidoglycan-binding domain-containing protein [Boseongicola sp. SB0667_bin_21]
MPPVILASAREGQTREAFEASAGRPGTVAASAAPSDSCTHTVAAGDTLGEISSVRLGTARRWREITALNPGLKPTALRPGQVLKL